MKSAYLETINEGTDNIGTSDMIEAVPQHTCHKLLAGEHEPVEGGVHALCVGICPSAGTGTVPGRQAHSPPCTAANSGRGADRGGWVSV